MPNTRAKGGSRSGKSGSGSGKVTVNHEEIRRWVEERGGRPACVKGTERGESCLLRIDYPGFSGEDTLEPMGWSEFFDTFDQNNLAFIYQNSKNGNPSRFSKFVSRDSAGGRRSSSRGTSQSRSGRGQSSGGRSRSGGQSRGGQARTQGRARGGGRSNKSGGTRASGRSGARASARGGARSSRRAAASTR